MSTPYEDGGYSNLKRRTREALVAAARDFVSRGVTPSVAQAASAASVSRTTAYRYFPNKVALLVAAHPEVGQQSLLGQNPPRDPAGRLDAVIATFIGQTIESEVQQRTMLRISLGADEEARAELPLRQGRAIGWITEALEPVRDQLTEPGLHRLVLAIRSAVGIEALVWLTDVAGLTRADATEVMQWSARSLLESALASGAPGILRDN